MPEFKKIDISAAPVFFKYATESELSCECAFVNLLVWQEIYQNSWAEHDGLLLVKSEKGGKSVYRLPLGADLEKGIELIRDFSGEEYPEFWVQDGKRLEEFKKLYAEAYTLTEERDTFDYVYSQNDLATLAGKKYHGKRNHISAFSKKHEWKYSPLTPENADDLRRCADEWYAENTDRADKYLLCESHGIELMLKNLTKLNIKGGLIYADGKAVAFTMGSQINSDVFDIHIEKALAQYSEAYTVINREFAANALADYRFINREDDMGLEGLRRAKLSYKPCVMVKKYSCKRS